MNSTLVFILILVTIVMSAEIVKMWLKRDRDRPAADEELTETLAKIDLLEERIKVLERIITENRFDLKNEIDSL